MTTGDGVRRSHVRFRRWHLWRKRVRESSSLAAIFDLRYWMQLPAKRWYQAAATGRYWTLDTNWVMFREISSSAIWAHFGIQSSWSGADFFFFPLSIIIPNGQASDSVTTPLSARCALIFDYCRSYISLLLILMAHISKVNHLLACHFLSLFPDKWINSCFCLQAELIKKGILADSKKGCFLQLTVLRMTRSSYQISKTKGIRASYQRERQANSRLALPGAERIARWRTASESSVSRVNTIVFDIIKNILPYM